MMTTRWTPNQATTPTGACCHVMESALPEPGYLIPYKEEKFRAIHPLSERHLTLFRMVQQRNQPWPKFYAQWEEAYRNANMDAILVGDKLAVTLLIAGTRDDKLVHEFQKLDWPTIKQLLAVAVKYEVERDTEEVIFSSISINRTSSGDKRRQRYTGSNKDNYVRAHFKKLEAEGKCIKCAEPIGPQGMDAHKISCKAKGASCGHCRNMGARANGHLAAACAKKLHAQARNRDDNNSTSSSDQQGLRYTDSNKDNYVRAHLKKLEAEGKCIKCAEPIGPQGMDAHKISCKAKGASCGHCISRNMGARAKGHLAAACAKKFHTQAHDVDTESNSGDECTDNETVPCHHHRLETPVGKPDRLDHNATTAELQEWFDKLKAYWRASDLLRTNSLA